MYNYVCSNLSVEIKCHRAWLALHASWSGRDTGEPNGTVNDEVATKHLIKSHPYHASRNSQNPCDVFFFFEIRSSRAACLSPRKDSSHLGCFPCSQTAKPQLGGHRRPSLLMCQHGVFFAQSHIEKTMFQSMFGRQIFPRGST